MRDNRRDRRNRGKAGEHENEKFSLVARPGPPPHRLRSCPRDHDARSNEVKPSSRVPCDQEPCRRAKRIGEENAREEADRDAREETRVTPDDAKGKPKPEAAPPPRPNWAAARHQWFRAATERAASFKNVAFVRCGKESSAAIAA